MKILDLVNEAKNIKALTNSLREKVFRVVPLASDFYAVLYLSEDLQTIESSALNSLFLTTDLDSLTPKALLEYAELQIKLEAVPKLGIFNVEGCEKAKASMIKVLRDQRKGIDEFGMVDAGGRLL